MTLLIGFIFFGIGLFVGALFGGILATASYDDDVIEWKKEWDDPYKELRL